MWPKVCILNKPEIWVVTFQISRKFLMWQNTISQSFSWCSHGKGSACNAGDPVWSLGWDDPLEKGMATHFIYFFPFIFISWRIITLQYCSGFCHTLTRISHGFTCVHIPIPLPASLPIPSLWVIPVHQPWALVSCIQPGLVICFTLDSMVGSMLYSKHPTLAFSHRV